MVIPVLFYALISAVGIFGAAHAEKDNCGFSGKWLDSVAVSRDLLKRGFHRELKTTVQYGPLSPDGLQALLVQTLPRGVFMDPYQLASLHQDTGLQVLLDSEVDLEAPAYLSQGFSAFVYATWDPEIPGRLQAAVPIHGRYRRPSGSGRGWERVEIEPPRMLLRREGCQQLLPTPPHVLVDAPCTFRNLSRCRWLEIQLPQGQMDVSLELPVGNQSLVVSVCAGTLLVTLLCCALITRAVWRHGFLQAC
ncbi:phosphatidylinositol-glycan biosynthesis class X protein [Megalops cyprinoides]|uniref:phosphatidylinositol-glycan biosynthesis class X protein n=1 Tax=Megalops cyprinoides TaxID=118141 RepID=UPI001863E510|nr:phosphatidylinositol-glycan biosynthesis class X protein [Megalops cyprinoides]